MLQEENKKLKNDLNEVKATASHLTDKKTRFYTGIPTYQAFLWVVSTISAFLPSMKTLSKADQTLLTLMKLRLGLVNLDLAYRFSVSEATVSRVIGKVIPALAARLKHLIKWPTKSELIRNMPQIFRKKYLNCVTIIDCSEIFIERPFNLTTRCQTWSSYKHHNTVKVLLGITPYGSVGFVSECYGGRISDKEITKLSGFYKYINHGDMVMADRGFTIAEELAVIGATLAIPPFIKGRKQLPGTVVTQARHLSAVRIHVERAFERIKNFKILKHIVPVTLTPLLSEIFVICSAITNLHPKLVKKRGKIS